MAVVKDIDMGWNELKKNIAELKGAYTEVGSFGDGSDNVDTNVAYRMAVNEFGVPKKGIPARPVNRRAFDGNKKAIGNWMLKQAQLVLSLKMSPRKAIARVGEDMQKLIQKTYITGRFAPNDPKTIKRKKSSRPLVWSGEMRRETKHKDYMRGFKK